MFHVRPAGESGPTQRLHRLSATTAVRPPLQLDRMLQPQLHNHLTAGHIPTDRRIGSVHRNLPKRIFDTYPA